MIFSRALILLTALVFVAYGIGFALAPLFMSNLVTNGFPSTPAGITDMRSTYGGMSIGLGILLALAARSTASVRLGLLGVFAAMAGMGSTRALGLFTDRSGNAVMYAYLALEVGAACAALIALRPENDLTV